MATYAKSERPSFWPPAVMLIALFVHRPR